jgi:hypothetical protein
MASQTQRALSKRAIDAVEFMERCEKWITEEAADQKVELFSNATVTLSAKALGDIVYTMRGICHGIRQLEGNLTREKIRGRGHL